ncbi:hypothetical protein T459_18033 [Capsicum annuum]|uniref:Structural maintenance of chromosomes protein 3 n=1 Tax=Capsicum annuum TaxID=4072 RepID=A0A2G2ZDK3_CAPAN|nr:hypothetical protein T459_18033 [Capsicum annuum]
MKGMLWLLHYSTSLWMLKQWYTFWQVDKEEVRLRRTIGLKKDEYFLDGKHITKTEVQNLLESAGFSRSNPYYVVQQGKIASLTLMKDSERLDLLKEIGGTRVYEERRRESNKRKQIIQVVQYLDERLNELEQEKEELKKYQQLDKQRKSLEYTIYDKELHDARQKLNEVEEARNKVSENSTKMYESVLEAHEKSKELEKLSKDLTKEIQIFSKEKEAAEKQRTEAIRKRAKLDLDYKDLQEKMSTNIKAKDDAQKQLMLLEREVQETKNALNDIKPLYEKQVKEEEDIKRGFDNPGVLNRIMDREKRLSILYQKQGRATQFASKAARDKWLQKEIDEYERVLSSNLMQSKSTGAKPCIGLDSAEFFREVIISSSFSLSLGSGSIPWFLLSALIQSLRQTRTFIALLPNECRLSPTAVVPD